METEADQRAFDATLAFLDEYDADLELSGVGYAASRVLTPQHGVTSSEASQSENDADDSEASTGSKPQRNRTLAKKTAVETTPADGGASNRTRKEELLYLRGTVEKLEEQLRVLKQGKRKQDERDDAFVSTPTKTTTFSVPSKGSSMWEDVAMLQFEQRKDSEVENMRLRGLLESQIKLANGLERLIKRTNVDLLLPQNRLKRSRYSSSLDPSNDVFAFDELLAINNEMYSTLDEQFTHPHFEREDVHLQEVDVDHDIRSGAVVDVYEGRNLPFDLHTTADAVWRYYARLSQKTEPEHLGRDTLPNQLAETTDDLIKRHFHFTVHVNRHAAIFRGRIVARRYFEEGRVVIVWNALIEPEMPGGGREGMLVRQKGWTIIKRPKHLPPQCGPEDAATRIQSRYVVVPYVYDDVPDSKRKAGTLTNFVLESVHSHLEHSRKMTENVLILGIMNKS
ncbi:hypothetical protein Poli38472_004901 [Pythium oligandrum]|uniref:Uncharacterized protein n=1 Tax=Pythium oligandrum TaxID=41045 RepID=A0A8K1CCI7_PYTOL|nr:hypothetical protein Poli38472_004901 [Pythium oligandrum]|eukprot:TMW59832.1 hypothetical protein Poli38472_004901 [Pythium oligandrum]